MQKPGGQAFWKRHCPMGTRPENDTNNGENNAHTTQTGVTNLLWLVRWVYRPLISITLITCHWMPCLSSHKPRLTMCIPLRIPFVFLFYSGESK